MRTRRRWIQGLLSAALMLSVGGCDQGQRRVVVHRPNCQVCHAPRDEKGVVSGIELAHPGINLGCVACHGGNDWVCDGTKGGTAEVPTCDGDWLYNKALAHVQPRNSPPFLKNLSARELDSVDRAYLRFVNPGDFRVQDQTCGVCHMQEAANLPRSTMAHTAGEVSVARHRAGLQPDARGVFASVSVSDPGYVVADVCASPALEQFVPPAFVWDDTALASGGMVAAAQEQYLAKSCLGCHLSDFGENRFAGDFRSSGCTSCHMPYRDDGLSRSADPRVSKQTVPHPEKHQLVAAAASETCAHCHHQGGRIGVSYQGYRESAGSGLNPAGATSLNRALHGHDPTFYLTDEDSGNDFDETPPDVHFERGMDCVDCHTTAEVHGNGHLYASAQCAITTTCEDCHGTVRAYATLTPLRPNLTRRDGQFFLATKVSRKELPVPQVKDSVTPGHPRYTPLAAQSMGVNAQGDSHTDKVDCVACHAGWLPSCYGCHVDMDFSRARRYQTNGTVVPGDPLATPRWVALFDLVLMRSSSGKLAPSMPAERLFMTIAGVDGKDSLGRPMPTAVTAKPRVFTRPDGTRMAGFGQRAFDPHTTRRTSQFMACDRCHSVGNVQSPANQVLLDITHGFGSQRFPQMGCNVENEDHSCNDETDQVVYQLDAIQTREGKPLVVVGHPHPVESRPLTLDEIARMRQIVVTAGENIRTPMVPDALTNPGWPAAQKISVALPGTPLP